MAVRMAVCACLLYRAIRFATDSSAAGWDGGQTCGGVARSGRPTARGITESTASRLHELCHGFLDLMHCMHQHASSTTSEDIKPGQVSSFVRWSVVTAMEAIAGIADACNQW